MSKIGLSLLARSSRDRPPILLWIHFHRASRQVQGFQILSSLTCYCSPQHRTSKHRRLWPIPVCITDFDGPGIYTVSGLVLRLADNSRDLKGVRLTPFAELMNPSPRPLLYEPTFESTGTVSLTRVIRRYPSMSMLFILPTLSRFSLSW
jgi:hypothetical protein